MVLNWVYRIIKQDSIAKCRAVLQTGHLLSFIFPLCRQGLADKIRNFPFWELG